MANARGSSHHWWRSPSSVATWGTARTTTRSKNPSAHVTRFPSTTSATQSRVSSRDGLVTRLATGIPVGGATLVPLPSNRFRGRDRARELSVPDPDLPTVTLVDAAQLGRPNLW